MNEPKVLSNTEDVMTLSHGTADICSNMTTSAWGFLCMGMIIVLHANLMVSITMV